MSATLTLLTPGLHTLIVDGGRPRTRSLGVPLSGAADRFALAVGNALVGNPPETAALEMALMGPCLVADQPLACVVTGAPFALQTNHRQLRVGTTFTLEAGEELRIGSTSRGMRGYLCLRGGIDAPLILGSRSSLTPVRAGETFSCHAGRIAGRRAEVDFLYPPVLRVLPGPQASWFGERRLTQAEVTPASNRMGLRLRGEPLPFPEREMISEPVCPGVVQVTREGQCIVLGVEGQTIGGYPKIAQVIAADLDRIGQLRPGEQVRFEYVSQEQAEALGRERSAQMREWQTRLGLSAFDALPSAP